MGGPAFRGRASLLRRARPGHGRGGPETLRAPPPGGAFSTSASNSLLARVLFPGGDPSPAAIRILLGHLSPYGSPEGDQRNAAGQHLARLRCPLLFLRLM